MHRAQGALPVKLLSDKFIDVRLARLLHDSGNEPEKIFVAKFKTFNFGKEPRSPQLLGNVPDSCKLVSFSSSRFGKAPGVPQLSGSATLGAFEIGVLR